jgi:hypothetical protein
MCGSEDFTQEDFLRESKEKHGDFYDYSLTKFTKKSGKVKIVCPIHGKFEQCAYNHLEGRKPLCCSGVSKEEFLKRFKDVHGDRYDYSKAIIKGNWDKIDIVCLKHGVFRQTPAAHHRQRQGCPACGAERLGKWKLSNSLDFKNKAEKLHNGRYDYSLVSYEKSHLKVQIVCNQCCSSFWQSPNAHLAGKGCRSCNLSGFTYSKPAYFYVLSSGDITKVGITNKRPQDRVNDVSRSSGKTFAILDSFHLMHGEEALQVESEVLKELKALYKNPPEKFNGYTECFLNVDVENLQVLIRNKLADKEVI